MPLIFLRKLRTKANFFIKKFVGTKSGRGKASDQRKWVFFQMFVDVGGSVGGEIEMNEKSNLSRRRSNTKGQQK